MYRLDFTKIKNKILDRYIGITGSNVTFPILDRYIGITGSNVTFPKKIPFLPYCHLLSV